MQIPLQCNNYTRIIPDLDDSNEYIHLIDFLKCAISKGKGTNPRMQRKSVHHLCLPPLGIADMSESWLLDSGASLHVTSYENDFIDLERLPEKIPVNTASTPISIIGIGTALLRHSVIQSNGMFLEQVTRLFC